MVVNLMMIILVMGFGLNLNLNGQVQAVKMERIIGEEDNKDDVFFSANVTDIYVDKKNDNIYVMDTGANTIRVFNSKGDFICDIGRKGQGPAEYLELGTMCGLSNGQYLVADPGNRRLQYFSVDWKPLQVIRTKDNRVTEVVPGENGFFYTTPNKGSKIFLVIGNQEGTQPVVYKINAAGDVIKTLGSSPITKDFYLSEMNRNVTILYGQDKLLYVIYSIVNKIEVYKEDKLVKTSKIPLKFNPVEPKSSMKQRGDSFYMELQMDWIASDAAWNNNGKLVAAVYQESTYKAQSKKDNPPAKQNLCLLDVEKGTILKEWSAPKPVKAFDFLKNNRVVLLFETVEGCSLGIGTIK